MERREDNFFDLFQSDEHADVPGTNPHEVGSESIVEGQGSFLFEGFHYTIRDSGVVYCFVHHPSLYHIKRRTEAGSCESCKEGTYEMQVHVVWHRSVL